MNRLLTEDERREKFETKWPEWKLLEFTHTKGFCRVQHKCGNIKNYERYENIEKRGPTCQVCVDTKIWYWNIGDTIGDLTIINRRSLPNTLQEYQYKCNVCGFDGSKPVYIKGEYNDSYWISGHCLKNNTYRGGRGCVCCRGFATQPGINDAATTAKDILDYFLDKTEAYQWTKSSKHKINTICPICNTVQPNKREIQKLFYEGFGCVSCGSGISYPEKIMYFLLSQLNIDFNIHKVFEWSKTVYDEYDKQFHAREYDFYIPSINSIVEMHGRQHYEDCIAWKNKIEPLEHRQKIDTDKQVLAEQKGYNYIVIDCRESTAHYIMNNILKSELSVLLNMDDVDWDKISKDALHRIAKLVVDDKKNNPTKTAPDLAKQYNISLDSVLIWLKNANLYDKKNENLNAGIKRSYPIYSPELGKAFRSSRLASEEIGVNASSINRVCRQRAAHAGKHPVTGERLTWERWTLEQYEEWCKTNNSTIQN